MSVKRKQVLTIVRRKNSIEYINNLTFIRRKFFIDHWYMTIIIWKFSLIIIFHISNLSLKGPCHDQLFFDMSKPLICWFQRYIFCQIWLFSSPRIKQKLKILVLARNLKLVIRNKTRNSKLVIRNKTRNSKVVIRNKSRNWKLVILN